MRLIRPQLIFNYSEKILRSQNYWYNKYVLKTDIHQKLFCTNQFLNSAKPLHAESSADHYDIIISGGGMVGFATGCALGSSSLLSNKRILILEQQKDKNWHLPEEYSNRVSSLNFHSVQLFKKMGAWDHIEALRAHPVRHMQVWESCSEAMITFDEYDFQETIAYVVENDVILHALKKQCPDNVEVIFESKISGYQLPESTNSLATVTFDDGKCITTDLLIGADGRNSKVREAMGCKYLSWEYDHMGIVATLLLSEEQENVVAWQKFTPAGIIALLPLSSRCCSLVWSTTREACKRLLSLSEADFTDALNNTVWKDEFDPLVQNIHSRWQNMLQTFLPGGHSQGLKQLPPSFSEIVPKSRAAFPLGLGHAAHYVGPRVALIGDAAHRVHPLAGQGVNLGFGDVSALLTTLENAVQLGNDIGDDIELHQYETTRQRYNVSLMAAVDGLYRLYATQFSPIVLLRSIGLSTVDAVTPLKKRVMAHAEGQSELWSNIFSWRK